MNPDTGAFEPASGLTQQGRVRDDFGNWFGCDNSHLLWHYPLADEYVRRNPYVAAPNPAVQVPRGRDWNRLFPASETAERFNDPSHVNRVTSACGLEIYRDELLGKEFYGNAFVCEPVHNVVHREVLTPDGITFRSARATNELDREFLASTDNWFRPVQVRTGPDGALWVVDMYRYVIEHPRWIPSNRLAQLDVRAGHDKGRIYRVYRKDQPPRRIQNFAKLSTAKLATALDSPNGTERDIIHRELLNRADRSANEQLSELAKSSSRPAVRVQASAALHGLGGSTSSAVASESNPDVRVQMLRASGHRADILSEVARGIDAPDVRVRFQSALALGGHDHADQWLAKLLPEAATNQWMRAAVLSSSTNVAPKLLSAAVALPESAQQRELFAGLLATATATASTTELARIIVTLSPTNESEVTAWRLDALTRLLERPFEKSAAARESIGRTLSLARTVLTRPFSDASPHEAALRFMATQIDGENDAAFYQLFLQPGPLQTVAVEALSRSRSPLAARALVSHWGSFSPALRAKAIDQLATRPEWLETLLTAVERKQIPAAEISAPLRARLLSEQDESFRQRAAKLWPPRASDRAKLVAEYRKAIMSDGNGLSGREMFDQHCASCHALNGRGQSVGPDLTPWREKSAEDFLMAILDPNAAIEPRYVNYVIRMKNGGVLYGVIRSETATGVEIAAPGIQQTLLRSDIARLEAAPLSLMPEGLEQNITPVQMNDLLAFLKKSALPVFGSATGEQIRVAREVFRSRQPNGFGRLVFASEQLDYPGWLGRLPLLHCRQTDGKSRLAWQTMAAKSSGDTCSFVVPAAMGFLSQPAGKFTLNVNGKRALDFDVTLNDRQWKNEDGTVRMAYEVMEANSEDSNGVLTILLARELVKKNMPVPFEVVGSPANSQRWFGIYDWNAVQATAAR